MRYVAGVDEAGVGPLAGPVVAAAVVMPVDCGLVGVDDTHTARHPATDTSPTVRSGGGRTASPAPTKPRVNPIRTAVSRLPV